MNLSIFPKKEQQRVKALDRAHDALINFSLMNAAARRCTPGSRAVAGPCRCAKPGFSAG